MELDAAVDEEQVAEVFVRINSEGVKLNQADFILTLMSVFWDEGRKQLEAFSRAAKAPSISTASSFNWYISPSPDQLLRVVIALTFDRAVLRHAYSILRGKDLETGHTSLERRDQQFQALQSAQAEVLKLTHWHEYLRALERSGYRSAKMISSQNVVLFSYALWLRGRVRHGVPVDQLREVIARWFFMARLTSRYSGSFETQAERDFGRIDELAAEIGFKAAQPNHQRHTDRRFLDDHTAQRTCYRGVAKSCSLRLFRSSQYFGRGCSTVNWQGPRAPRPSSDQH
ncbi:hypothetical protein [Sinomonas mesophila]|uniref:hypothetical protein n=1 Tax=Sinomonas mesophila TaxID=1531955 RepID=UPI001C379CA2|nr:hypothetical protein [Sinomonas mesophila]